MGDKDGQDDVPPPLIVHIIFRLATGGLENGLVNLINAMPADRYQHAIVSLTDSTVFRERIQRADVPIYELQKQEGHDLAVYLRAWKILRSLRPDIVHTRNFPTLEFLGLAALAIRSGRVHGEHGRDMYDLHGARRKHHWYRRLVQPFVHRYIAVSQDLAEWLVNTVQVPKSKVRQIYNGVNSERFSPRSETRAPIGPPGFAPPGTFVVGTVGRMFPVKDQLNLVHAVLRLLNCDPRKKSILRLVMIGDGPLRGQCLELLRSAGAEEIAWLPGDRNDVPDLMRGLDLFVLPSLGEGISNTVLEAMACGLPVLATKVGGNVELVDDGITGMLVAPADPIALAEGIRCYLDNPSLAEGQGQAGRQKIEQQFSMEAMVEGYLAVYDAILNQAKRTSARVYQDSVKGRLSNVRVVRNL